MKHSSHTVKSFEQELDSLITSIQVMKDMAIDLISLSQQSLVDSKKDFYKSAQLNDKKVNKLEKEIEEQAISLLALRQPMASDLRIIVSTIKIISLLERIADRGKKTIKVTRHLEAPLSPAIIKEIFQMNKVVIHMINQVFRNLESYALPELKEAIEEDDKVDEFYTQITQKIINIQKTNPLPLEEFIAQIKILKNFERMGDYATKIAKIIYYIAEGSNKKF